MRDRRRTYGAGEKKGYELTKEEAEAYLAELEDFELDSETLSQAAGGDVRVCYPVDDCPHKFSTT